MYRVSFHFNFNISLDHCIKTTDPLRFPFQLAALSSEHQLPKILDHLEDRTRDTVMPLRSAATVPRRRRFVVTPLPGLGWLGVASQCSSKFQ